MKEAWRETLSTGTKCYHCEYIQAIKVTQEGSMTGEILCGYAHKMVHNNWHYCKFKKEILAKEELYEIGELVQIKQELQVGKRYKGVLFQESMKIESGYIQKIDILYNKVVYQINGFSYTSLMLEKYK